MAQGLLAYKYEQEKKDTGMTGLAGLPLYMDLASAMGTGESIEQHLHIKQQGWTDRQTLLSLIMMNLAGGDCVEDLRKLKGDTGFYEVLRCLEQRRVKRESPLPADLLASPARPRADLTHRRAVLPFRPGRSCRRPCPETPRIRPDCG